SAAAGPFVKNAFDVLKSSERIADGRDIAVVTADELTQLPALITAPSDPVRLGAANRALERAGVPWRFGARRTGEASVRGRGFEGVTTAARYDLAAQAGAAAATVAVGGRGGWDVSGPRYRVRGAPPRPHATKLSLRPPSV